MSYLTLAQARQTLWKYAAGADDTFVAFASATAADKLAVSTAINHTIERFINRGKWRGDTVRARFRTFDGQITLPSTLSCILGATPIRDTNATEDATGVASYGIYSMEHEFSVSGPGNPSSSSLFGLVDLGDNFASFIDPGGEFYLKVYSTTAETATILLKGLDSSSAQIYTAGVEGVSLALGVSPGLTTSPQAFTFFSSWQKSATTTGVIRIYSVDTTTAEETLLVIIPPGKTTSGYHRYRVPDSDWGDTVECLCKRAYVPAVADNDLIIPTNIGALKLGMMALRYEDKNDPANASLYWGPNEPDKTGKMAGAFDLLNSELAQFEGDAVIPTVQFRRHYGAGEICNIR